MDGRPPGRHTFTAGRDGCYDHCYDGFRCAAGPTIGFPTDFPLGILTTSGQQSLHAVCLGQGEFRTSLRGDR